MHPVVGFLSQVVVLILFYRNLCIVSHYCCATYIFIKSLLSLFSFIFFIMFILTGIRLNHTIILICLSLVLSNFEHLFHISIGQLDTFSIFSLIIWVFYY